MTTLANIVDGIKARLVSEKNPEHDIDDIVCTECGIVLLAADEPSGTGIMGERWDACKQPDCRYRNGPQSFLPGE